jgi:N-acetylglucosamine-6-phosphate deacetylase
MEASPEAFAEILRYHGARGTTLAVLSTVAASREEMTAVLTAAEKEMARVRIDQTQQPPARQARFGGIHLEGPYFSLKRRGAHRAEQIRVPSTEETRILLGHSDVIARMTLAPELPGSLELVRELTVVGIPVSAGHSDATEEEARAGFASGITQVTHLYNCMSSLVR